METRSMVLMSAKMKQPMRVTEELKMGSKKRISSSFKKAVFSGMLLFFALLAGCAEYEFTTTM